MGNPDLAKWWDFPFHHFHPFEFFYIFLFSFLQALIPFDRPCRLLPVESPRGTAMFQPRLQRAIDVGTRLHAPGETGIPLV